MAGRPKHTAPAANLSTVWRLDDARFAATWDSGIGAEMFGGRWNSKGLHAVYCAADPATCILEAAVHKGFMALDRVAHVLTQFEITRDSDIFRLDPESVPNAHWLRPGAPSAGQQQFGDELLRRHAFVAVPSTVSRHSWNVIFNPTQAAGKYRLISQEAFALDGRLNPPK